MLVETPSARLLSGPRRWWPEVFLALLAAAVFLGCLGSVEIWGKREQRAAAEAIDTIEHNHWLVAQIQGRPRLEKPPLPRWSIAALMIISGRRDEAIVRLPGAVAGAVTVAIVYLLGRRMGGGGLGLASGFVLCSMGFFVGEMRQASNDAPLVLFTTLALYAAYRLIHDHVAPGMDEDEHRILSHLRQSAHGRAWRRVFYVALGLGCLTKGPVILLLVGVTVVPYLACSRQLTSGLGRLCDGWGLAVFTVLVLFWPAAVLLDHPSAGSVWALEMSEKTGLSHILEHRRHAALLGQWPGMVLPWTPIALVAAVMPFLSRARRESEDRPATMVPVFNDSSRLYPVWFAWWWAVGNLVMLCLWSVAKPNYYLPCLPGTSVLIGSTWAHLCGEARGQNRGALAARGILQAQWVVMFVAAAVAPLAVREYVPETLWPLCLTITLAITTSVALSAYLWRRGADALALAPVTAACVFGILIAYGIIAPAENAGRSHRVLARKLQQVIPSRVRSINFFNEIDEGLWFYLNGFDLAPVPGTHPRYNTAFDLAQSFLTGRLPTETISDVEAKRQARDKQALLDWLDRNDVTESCLLIRSSLYDRFASDLAGRVVPLLRETGMKRNELTLLQVAGHRTAAATAAAVAGPRR
jgi:4-amino-4-deoxy-L-arabinose transferase-like glycosyltransferase